MRRACPLPGVAWAHVETTGGLLCPRPPPLLVETARCPRAAGPRRARPALEPASLGAVVATPPSHADPVTGLRLSTDALWPLRLSLLSPGERRIPCAPRISRCPQPRGPAVPGRRNVPAFCLTSGHGEGPGFGSPAAASDRWFQDSPWPQFTGHCPSVQGQVQGSLCGQEGC